jgi:hypothetical protein
LIAQLSNMHGVEKSIRKDKVFQKLIFDLMSNTDTELPDALIDLMIADLKKFYSYNSKRFRKI